MAINIYQMVTDRIISELEQGVIPWEKPWTGKGDGAWNRVTGKPYSFLNQMLLGKPGEYLTFKQCTEAGGKVKKGEKSSICVFWKQVPVEEEKDGVKKTKLIPMLRYYNVFHIDQCEGIEQKHHKQDEEGNAVEFDPIEEAEKILSNYLAREGIKLENVLGDKACYRPSHDDIILPKRNQFQKPEEYYSTAYHEATHSTGHSSRLNRLKSTHFASGEYSKEELVAEMGSAMSLNRLGIDTDHSTRNSAAYIKGWLENIKGDNKLVVSAASKAEKAVKMIFGDEAV